VTFAPAFVLGFLACLFVRWLLDTTFGPPGRIDRDYPITSSPDVIPIDRMRGHTIPSKRLNKRPEPLTPGRSS